MTLSSTQQLLRNVSLYSMNPSSIQMDILNVLDLALNGDDIVDPTSPFIFSIEAAATCTAGAIMASEAVTRQLYPPLAQTQVEIFHHMSDKDYVNIYAIGAMGTITFLIPYNGLLQNAVPVANAINVSSAIIPRNTQISVNNITLDIGYPININVLSNQFIQIAYDTTITNPLFPISGNVIDHALIVFNSVQYLQITVPVLQAASTSTIYTLNSLSSFTQTIPFLNSYAYARVFYSNSAAGPWIEMLTTYTPLVYDITIPTMVLSVNNNILTAILPDIYQTMQLAGNNIRIDVYNTIGAIDVDISQLSYNNFSAIWQDFDTYNTNKALSVLSVIKDIIIYSTAPLLGGSPAATLEQIRNRAIYHVDSTIVPIRNSSVAVTLSSYGYQIETLIDSVTNKVFIASKNLPARVVNEVSSNPLALNANVLIGVNEAITTGAYDISVLTNPALSRATISPNALYLMTNGTASLLNDAQINNINNLFATNLTQLTSLLNSGFYLYSPFHYVIDFSLPTIVGRPYYLTSPSVLGRTTVASNTIRVYNISTISTSISLVNNQYVLVLTASVPLSIPLVLCQLSYTNSNNGGTIYLNAISDMAASPSGQATFTFYITTSFDVDSSDELELIDFINTNNSLSNTYLNLTSTFNIFYLVPGSNTGLNTTFDNLYLIMAAMPAVIGASYETITLKFGQTLPRLYCPTQEIMATGTFQQYTEIVYATYTTVIYKSTPTGYAYTLDSSGNVVFTILHNIGDFILDSSGNKIVLHNVGDYILDGSGKMIPTLTYTNSIKYSIGLTLFDARYIYVTSGRTGTNTPALIGTTAAYTQEIPNNVIGYLSTEIAAMAGGLNEKTELWYKPMGETHNLEILTGNGAKSIVSGILNIGITFLMTEDGLNDPDIITKIKDSTRQVISNQVALNQITLNGKGGFVDTLSALMPTQVKGFEINSFLPNNATMVTIVDITKTFTIGESLVVQADGTTDIIDTIDLLFIPAT